MTLQDCIDNRRWAEHMMNDTKEAIKIKHTPNLVREYWYLNEWLSQFDRLITNFTCWPEHHINYQSGFSKLKNLSKSL